MKSNRAFATARALAFAALVAGVALAQGTLADYQRAQGLQAKARGLVTGTPAAATWIGDSGQFWYSRTVKGGSEFLMVDAASATKKPAFDHDKLAAFWIYLDNRGWLHPFDAQGRRRNYEDI